MTDDDVRLFHNLAKRPDQPTIVRRVAIKSRSLRDVNRLDATAPVPLSGEAKDGAEIRGQIGAFNVEQEDARAGFLLIHHHSPASEAF